MDFADILAAAPADGLILEFGVFRGGSLRQICAAAAPRIVYGFDWFRGLPEHWLLPHYRRGTFDTGGRPPDRIPKNGKIVVGLVQDTLGPFLSKHPDDPIAFVHFDMDIYSATSCALMTLKDRFRAGSICLFDEWMITDHEQRAFGEFLRDTGWRAEYLGRRNRYAHAFRLN